MDYSNQKYYILFLDDEEKSVKYFQKLFGCYFKIIATTNPNEALQTINQRSEEIAVFVSDQRMPNFSGVDLLATIKEKNNNIITVLTTAYASLENNIAAINKGNVFAYLTKPWNVEEVKLLLEKALNEFEAKQNYLSLSGSIAHEMRNPLNNVRQSSRIIKEKLSSAHMNEKICGFGQEKITPLLKQDFHEIISSLDFVENTVERGNAIIDIILNNISGKSLISSNLVDISVFDILKKVVNEYAFKDNEKDKLILETDNSVDFTIRCDENSLIYVFFNLIKNSLYYLKINPQLNIKIRTEKGSDQFNRIYFYDNGPGIPQDKLKNLFGAFSTSGKKEGTGLGLTFCKRVMEDLGGKISCNSEEGKFTEFTLEFPNLTQKEQNEFFSNKILLLDNDEVNLLTVKSLLEKKLHSTKCDIINNSNQAINLIKSNNYSVILTDIEMPEINGIEFAKEIRKFDNSTPILAYSSKNLLFMVDDLKYAGFNGYISKNSSRELLIKIVSNWSLTKIVNNLVEKKSQHLFHQKKILIADDEESNLILMTKYLSRYKAKIEHASNGFEVLDLVKKNEYDLILMDIQMPELNGLETIQEIKRLQQNNNLHCAVIIAFTGDNSKAKIHKILNAGFDDYFIKGNSYDELSEIIEFWGEVTTEKNKSFI